MTLLFNLGMSLLILLAALLIGGVRYFNRTYGAKAEQVFYTAVLPLEGTGGDTVIRAVRGLMPALTFALVLVFAVSFLSPFCPQAVRLFLFAAVLLAIAGGIRYADKSLNASEFFRLRRQQTDIYEKEYVRPGADRIVPREGQKPKNLIYIYLEGMESTFAGTAQGGKQKMNHIPHMTDLAEREIHFSDTDKLGGAHNTAGTGWTMGAIFAMSSGVPFAFPIGSYLRNLDKRYAKGLVTLGDILHRKGYRQEFMCGSDAAFGARKAFFEQHGDYEIFDLNTARERGYIPKDYYQWWGFEDRHLYRMAKEEIIRLAAGEKPFNFTMLTVDTHFVSGYKCPLCRDDFPTDAENIVACADRQLAEFLDWLSAQPFAADTAVVITGDHPRMDTYMVKGLSYYERPIYNCFLQAAKEPAAGKNGKNGAKNRVFTPMDMLPTVLSAMGFEIPGNRLGLGTDLFCGKNTLAERMGFEKLNEELSKQSAWYAETFS